MCFLPPGSPHRRYSVHHDVVGGLQGHGPAHDGVVEVHALVQALEVRGPAEAVSAVQSTALPRPPLAQVAVAVHGVDLHKP